MVSKFFNINAGTYSTPAFLAWSLNIPIIPIYTYRLKIGKHVVKFLPEIPLEKIEHKEAMIVKNTNMYNNILENMLLEHPEQWLWFHRRWKL